MQIVEMTISMLKEISGRFHIRHKTVGNINIDANYLHIF